MGKSKELATLTDVGVTLGGDIVGSGDIRLTKGFSGDPDYINMHLTNTDTSSGIRMTSQSTNGRIYEIQSQNTGDFIIYDRTADRYRMTIDASGRLSMPYQPAFCYWMSDSDTAYNPTANNTVTIFRGQRTTWHNTGNHYNITNGRFTAPVTGVYHFDLHWISSAPSEAVEINYYIRHNGSYPITDGRNRGYTESSGDVSITIKLNANDYVEVCKNDGSGHQMYTSGHYSHFSGYLIG